MTIGIIAKLKIKEGKNEEFEKVFLELAAAVKANEPGNIFYKLHRSRQDANTYVVLEQYESQEALDAHGKSEHFKTIGPKMGGCLDGKPEIELLDAVE